MSLRPFHLAFPVRDLAEARRFYGEIMGCTEGRSSDHWIDFDFFGHQIVAHLDANARAVSTHNPVDGHDVPVPHFGVVLTMDQWELLAARVTAAGISFGIAPETRRKLEDDLTAEAIATFRAKADAVSLAWKAKGYKLVQLSLGTNGGGMPHPVMMRSAKMMDAEAVAAPVLAGGESRIAVNVSGSIELQP